MSGACRKSLEWIPIVKSRGYNMYPMLHFRRKFSSGIITSILEKGKGPEDFFLVAGKLLQGQAQIQRAGVEEGLSGTPFVREVWGREEFWPCSLFRRSGQSRGGRSNQRGRCRYRRQSDGWCRSGVGHKLGDLLYLSGQGHESGVYSMF